MNPTREERGEFLVAILKEKSDFAILQEQGWYRIPLAHAPRRWPPRWLGFYQPKVFKEEAYRVRYFGEVANIEVVKRKEMFPNEFISAKSEREYYQVHLKKIEERNEPIISTRPRRLVFIPTTWEKFILAEQMNDLFDDSPLEDRLWIEFKDFNISAERQWGVQINKQFYQLDFALFCHQGQVDIETDGDAWHAKKDRIPLDNQRDNDLQSIGWHVLRFNGRQVNEQTDTYCLGKITETINKLGGLNEKNMVPRVFYTQSGEIIQQLSLFEKPDEDYGIREALPIGID
ncbi:MAG: hypothetical protein A2Y53_08595 [Chloroflexi bacterium RBG_16_47_49]|nr:MAG: hypothetical protein A2Y53_08595 [Chloroflexi bacterium RBG_16_47_49]